MAKVVLNELAEGKEVLVMEVKHMNGVYRFTCNKQTEKNMDGYSIMEWIPFATGNFNTTIKTNSRKSQKKLEKLNNIIETNITKLTDLWKAGQYQQLVNFITPELQAVF